MKKIISLMIAVLLCFVMGACGRNRPAAPDEPVESVQPSAPEEPAEHDVQKDREQEPAPVDGGDWRGWRWYSDDMELGEGMTVCLSMLDEGTGYGVYDSSNGDRIGTLIAPKSAVCFYAGDIVCGDRDGEGLLDIGIVFENGVSWWYCLEDGAPAWPEDPAGGFRLYTAARAGADLTCFPYEMPEVPNMTPLAWEIYEEIWPKVEAVEYFIYDAETYGNDYLDQMLNAFGAIQILHPEATNYFMLREVIDENMETSLESDYSCRWDPDRSTDLEEVKAGIAAFDAKVEEILSGITDEMTAYEKYWYLAATVSENADYDYYGNTAVESAPWAGVMGGYAICSGYAAAMEYLCRRADLFCRTVGGSSEGEGHAWNLVKLPEGTYHVDVTWADGNGGPWSEDWMDYFMLTQEQIEEDHVIEDGTVATGP